MIWASRTFSSNGWFHVLDQFEEQFDAAGAPSDMMLCRVESSGRTTLYVGLPDAGIIPAYDGFQRCPQPGGVVQALLLMGDERAFDDLFHRRRVTRDRVD